LPKRKKFLQGRHFLAPLSLKVFAACADFIVLVLGFPIFDYENEDDFGCGSTALRRFVHA